MHRSATAFTTSRRVRRKRLRALGAGVAPLLLMLVNSCTTASAGVAPLAASHPLSRDGVAAVRSQGSPGFIAATVAAAPRAAASPFAIRARGGDAVRAQVCLASAIYYEAASEPEDGQRAVAQVVLNRVRHAAFPNSVCGVVFQGWELATGCQFSFTCDGAMARVPGGTAWRTASRIAREALAGAVYAPVGLATNYHRIDVAPPWSRTLVPMGLIGVHLFYGLNGPAGAPAAFRRAAAAHEPMPAPPPLRVMTAPLIMADYAPVVQQTRWRDAQTLPPLAASGEVLPAYEVTAESQILPQWRDSGTIIAR